MSKLNRDKRVARRAERKLRKADRLEAKSKAPVKMGREMTKDDGAQLAANKARQAHKASKLRTKYSGVESKADLVEKRANKAIDKSGSKLGKRSAASVNRLINKSDKLAGKAKSMRK